MINKKNEWFATWFDSPYYPILYRHRDAEEAQLALSNMLDYLKLPPSACVLDLGCGQGRHSRFLHSRGFQVVGIDLSPASIAVATTMAEGNQRFVVQDMRSFAVEERFDAVFNLFTSFGYFDDQLDNQRVLDRISAHMKKDGLLVLDYLNAIPLLKQDEVSTRVELDQLIFETRKFRQNNSIVKSIEVTDSGLTHHFQERVQLITADDFRQMLQSSGFEVMCIFGNYRLEVFNPEYSDRCLIIARKS
jgi:SAM-dependent methyltransferase